MFSVFIFPNAMCSSNALYCPKVWDMKPVL